MNHGLERLYHSLINRRNLKGHALIKSETSLHPGLRACPSRPRFVSRHGYLNRGLVLKEDFRLSASP